MDVIIDLKSIIMTGEFMKVGRNRTLKEFAVLIICISVGLIVFNFVNQRQSQTKPSTQFVEIINDLYSGGNMKIMKINDTKYVTNDFKEKYYKDFEEKNYTQIFHDFIGNHSAHWQEGVIE